MQKIEERILSLLQNKFFALFCILLSGCSILHTRPVQLMSDTAAAIRAAREVQADTLAPDYFRQANEWFFRAKNEYRLKNFKFAKENAEKARLYAEQAEFIAIQSGGSRTELPILDPLTDGPLGSDKQPAPTPTPEPSPYSYPTPTGTPAVPWGTPETIQPTPSP